MVKFISRIGHDASPFLLAAAMTGLLVGCGGSSGDSNPIDSEDADGDGIVNSEDDDADGDGILDELDLFVDLDNDGVNDADANGDADGDGILNADDFDADGDGTADIDDLFVDLNADGLDDESGLTEAVATAGPVPGDNDGDGFIDVTASRPCGGASARNSAGIDAATDADSLTSNWDDNCHVRAPGGSDVPVRQSSQFANSYYSVAIQRVVYCAGFGNGDSYTNFADGIFGPNTDAAVKEFQRDNDPGPVLTDDGIVGGQTWAKLRDSLVELEQGQLLDGGISYNSYGFDDGRCAGTPLFYQQFTLSEDQLSNIPGGWELARDIPNESQRAPFTTEFGDSFR